ncbi:MAG: Rrf2 family transcriptional regulator [Acidimicrobiia bacterium]|nr:Rrf2 family transcriptional regulator [Acidimicrobiia bacterium]
MRLELTTRTDLALRAIRALHRGGARMKRVDLAQELATTPDFLARVMGPLVHRGWVTSGTGPNGGYEVGDEISSVTIFALIECVEGAPDDSTCVLRGGPCDAIDQCALHDPWSRARKALVSELQASFVID